MIFDDVWNFMAFEKRCTSGGDPMDAFHVVLWNLNMFCKKLI